jgi:hypothetical protein
MILVYRGDQLIGSVIKTIIGKRPWYAYAADGPGENFKTRKEAEDWLRSRRTGATLSSHQGKTP